LSSNLPTRWQEILRREAAENVGTVLAQAKDQQAPRRVPRWTVPVLVVTFGSVSLLGLMDGTDARPSSGVPFDWSNVMSTRTAGLGASAEDLAPRPAPVLPTPPSFEPVVAPSASPADDLELKPRRRARRQSSESDCPDCDRRRAAMKLAEASRVNEVAVPPPLPTPTPKPAPLVINIGTRVQAVLTDPVVTGVALAPASAKLAADVYVGERLALPAGTALVGEGFATQEGDRAQVVFTSIVKDGKTIAFEGWALQQGEAGVRGKVVKKGSKVKKGAGSVLGAAASALTFGMSGAVPGPEGAALSALGNTAASDLMGLGREMRRSDKVVRVEAGVPVTVYIRRDLTLE
jgi:hypothetical protein